MLAFLDTIGLVTVATVFGSMVFFSAVVAPIAFIKLDKEVAGQFIRGIFPWYYLLIGIFSLIAVVSLAFDKSNAATLMAIVLIGALISRQMLMPNINKQRELHLAGDIDAKTRFDRLHRFSVLINLFQMCIVLYVLITFTI